MSFITCVPAYGKDYKSKKEVQAAWDEGKDFLINQIGYRYDGSYINKNDTNTNGLTLNIRYKNLTQVHVIKIKG